MRVVFKAVCKVICGISVLVFFLSPVSTFDGLLLMAASAIVAVIFGVIAMKLEDKPVNSLDKKQLDR